MIVDFFFYLFSAVLLVSSALVVSSRNPVHSVLFLILAFFVNVLGFLCLIVGLLVTVPVTFAAITIAYKELVGFDQQTIDSL